MYDKAHYVLPSLPNFLGSQATLQGGIELLVSYNNANRNEASMATFVVPEYLQILRVRIATQSP